MKQVILNYSFSTSGKTITLSDFSVSHPVDLKRLYLITDVTTNKILYNFADSTVTTATVSSNNVITLGALQGGEANGDSLQIVYEVLSTDPTYETPLLPANAAQETGGNLATIATDIAPLVSSSAGGYIRQDSTATIAKESGGNLASITTNTSNTATNTTGLNNTVGTAGSAIPTKGVVVQGSDGTNARALKTDTSGNVGVNVQNTVAVTGTFYQGTQPISGSVTADLADTSGNGITSNSTATSGKRGIDTNVLSILGTAPTTAGFLDVKGADGNVFVRQATAANLNATVVPGNATAATAPTVANEGGAIASTSLPTAVTNGQLVGVMGDKFGRQVIIPNATRDIVSQQSTTITASTGSTTVVTGISNVYADITSVVFANSGASSTLVTLSDGTSSYYFYVPAGDTRGATYHVPLSATNTGTNWTATCGTSTSSLYVTVQYIQNK